MSDVITSKDLSKAGTTCVARIEEERLQDEMKKEIWDSISQSALIPGKKKKKEKEPKRKKK